MTSTTLPPKSISPALADQWARQFPERAAFVSFASAEAAHRWPDDREARANWAAAVVGVWLDARARLATGEQQREAAARTARFEVLRRVVFAPIVHAAAAALAQSSRRGRRPACRPMMRQRRRVPAKRADDGPHRHARTYLEARA